MPFVLKCSVGLSVVVILYHILDRQLEYTSRTDYLTKSKLNEEQNAIEQARSKNKVCRRKLKIKLLPRYRTTNNCETITFASTRTSSEILSLSDNFYTSQMNLH